MLSYVYRVLNPKFGERIFINGGRCLYDHAKDTYRRR